MRKDTGPLRVERPRAFQACHPAHPDPPWPGHARRVQPWLTQRLRYAAGEAWFARDSSITVQGRSYRKHGLERVVGFLEITPYASYRGVLVLMEMGITGTPDIVYLPATANCRVQAYTLEPRP
jgi:hypothetical protein